MLKFIHTLRHLRLIQLYHLILYRIGRKLFAGVWDVSAPVEMERTESAGAPEIPYFTFFFLNRARTYCGGIHWNDLSNGLLWTYHLNYFEYLNGEAFCRERGLFLLECFAAKYLAISVGKEPYPTSIRIINWIKFLRDHGIEKAEFAEILRQDVQRLLRNLEFHLLANHLLENALALLFASLYFEDVLLKRKAWKLLRKELGEQILPDGGHFELSPMYHQIILQHLLDAIELMQTAEWRAHRDEVKFLSNKAGLMLMWLRNISFSNGDVPLVNDAANDIAPTSKALYAQGERLGIIGSNQSLTSSGYRMVRRASYELLLDVGKIGPDYQPGHAHADTFNFILHVAGRPIIVDTGTSTYEAGAIRNYERSTAAHNTVVVAGKNSSEVWGSFRVARRAYVEDLEERSGFLAASHTGYRRIGTTHRRSWQWTDDQITICDYLTGRHERGVAYLHFHPDVKADQADASTITTRFGVIAFEGHCDLRISSYQFAVGFNVRKEAPVAEITFDNTLVTRINLQAA